MSLIPTLFGLKVTDAARITRWPTLAFRSGIDPAWMVLATVLLAAVVIWRYHRAASHVGPIRRYSMALFRILFLVMILHILLRPVLTFVVEGTVRRTLIFLVDCTTSMKIEDLRTESDDLKRAAIAKDVLDPQKGLDQPLNSADSQRVSALPRIEVLKSVLKNQRLDLLNKLGKEYDLRAFTFSTTVTDLTPPTGSAEESNPADHSNEGDGPKPRAFGTDWIDKLSPNSPVTAIGDATREIMSRTRGQPLAGIVLMTDGGNNAGSDPIIAAKLAQQEGVPLYTYGVGISSPKDIMVANVFAPDVSFAKDEVPVTVRVRCQNLKGESGRLALTLGGTEVDHATVQFGEDGEQVIAMKFTPMVPGEYDLVASIPPRPDEAVKDNNSYTHHIRIVDGKIKVLLVEQQPRWEFEYLQQQLLRDRRVELKCVLIDADRGIVNAEHSPYLPEFPNVKEELFKYDLIILGDVDPHNLTADQIANMSEFVSKFGGGFLMVAGKNHAPADYVHTDIEKMLPVEYEAHAPPAPGTLAAADGNDKPIHIELTVAGLRTPMLRLSDKEVESAERWKNMPPIYWEYRVSRPKPAAEVLLVDSDPMKSSRFGKMPLVAVQQYGLGQVMWLGTDNTWRWRKNKGDEYYIALWGQMIQRLALPHLLGASKRTQLSCDKQQYGEGEDITVYARLYTSSYDPVTEPSVKGHYTNTTAADTVSRAARDVQLRPLPDQPGMYRGVFKAVTPGQYKFNVDHPGDPESKLEFAVTESKMEPGDTAMNQMLLSQMSQTSGGRFFREENIRELPDAIRLKAESVRSTFDVEIWSSPIYFLLLLLLVTIEWILRKTAQMK